MALTELSDLIQGSDAWLDQRRGMVTASVVGKLVTAKTIRPASNDESRALTALLVAERITGYTDPVYVSGDMLRGVEDEPRAVEVYSEHYAPVTPSGFMVRDDWGFSIGYSAGRAGRRRRPHRGQVAAGEEATADHPLRRGAAREHGAAPVRAARLRPAVDRLRVVLAAGCRCTSSGSSPTSVVRRHRRRRRGLRARRRRDDRELRRRSRRAPPDRAGRRDGDDPVTGFDLSDTIAPKSDQLDAVDLLSGPRTFTIERVSRNNDEQPINIHLAEFPRPWRPGLSMRRVLVSCWGKDAATYVGRRVTLYCDPDVQFGGAAVGGTRIRRCPTSTSPSRCRCSSSAARAPSSPSSPSPTLLRPLRPRCRPPTELIAAAEKASSNDASSSRIARTAAANLGPDELAAVKDVVTARRADLQGGAA
jgi:hypothetical protein